MSPRELPIYELEDRIIAAVKGQGRLIVQAPTGSGKSTQVPQMLLNHGLLGEGEVVVLQPRRLAARMLAKRVAEEVGTRLGEVVGYQIRLDSRVSKATRTRSGTAEVGALVEQARAAPVRQVDLGAVPGDHRLGVVADAREERGDEERRDRDREVLERLEDAGLRGRDAVGVLHLQDHGADAVEQDRKDEVVDEERDPDEPLVHVYPPFAIADAVLNPTATNVSAMNSSAYLVARSVST